MHKPENELKDLLQQAASKVKLGGLYSHYKNPENLYRVINIAITESDDSVCVVYEAQYGDHLVFVRPLKSWLDTVETPDGNADRFKLV